MDNFKLCTELNFDNDGLNRLLQNMQTYFKDQEKNFCKICFCVFQISKYFDNHYIGVEKKTNEYYDKNKLFEKFGFDKTAVSRMTKCYLKFMTGTNENDINLKSWFVGYSPSKLYELLKVSDLTLEDAIDKKYIIPDMTVKQIRVYVISLEDGKDKAEKVLESIQDEFKEEDIPMAYNPKEHYDWDYFKDKTKNQLLGMIWELQKEYEKLKSKKK